MKKLWMGLVALVLVSPLGMLASGTAWGEWGLEELNHLLGWVPHGLERFAEVNGFAPLPDYSLPGVPEAFLPQAGVYILSAVIGVGLCVGLVYALTWGKKD